LKNEKDIEQKTRQSAGNARSIHSEVFFTYTNGVEDVHDGLELTGVSVPAHG
jgi:hypothetical protein